MQRNYKRMEHVEVLNVEYNYPLFPWKNLKIELEHPDDLEENIFFYRREEIYEQEKNCAFKLNSLLFEKR